MKILVTGGSGLLGTNLGYQYSKTNEVFLGIHKTLIKLENTVNVELDFKNKKVLKNTLESISPDMIIHAAGYTNVDECEKNSDIAYEINCAMTNFISSESVRLGCKLVHVSTDHLFDGQKSFYLEDDIPSPMNVYGKSKLEAEQIVERINPDALIVRTNFFGWGTSKKSSFSDFIIHSLRNRRRINLFDDVYFTPILISRLGEIILKLVSIGSHGVFNVVGEERVSKFEFGIRLAQKFDCDQNLISRISIDTLSLPAKRPKDMSLSTKKLSEQLLESPGDLNSFFDKLRIEEANGWKLAVGSAIGV